MHNILVVEDDSDLNQAVCYALQKAGYGVEVRKVLQKPGGYL